MSNGEEVTMSVFDVEAMILSLLQDPELMKEENLVSDYNLHTGKPTRPVTHFMERYIPVMPGNRPDNISVGILKGTCH